MVDHVFGQACTRSAICCLIWLISYPAWRLVRASIALPPEWRAFCAACGVMLRSRHWATKSTVSSILSTPKVRRPVHADSGLASVDDCFPDLAGIMQIVASELVMVFPTDDRSKTENAYVDSSTRAIAFGVLDWLRMLLRDLADPFLYRPILVYAGFKGSIDFYLGAKGGTTLNAMCVARSHSIPPRLKLTHLRPSGADVRHAALSSSHAAYQK
jgi:hypothetical protein